jgi:hypothetical protein
MHVVLIGLFRDLFQELLKSAVRAPIEIWIGIITKIFHVISQMQNSLRRVRKPRVVIFSLLVFFVALSSDSFQVDLLRIRSSSSHAL